MEWDDLISASAEIHANHRISRDADHVLHDLRERFPDLLQMMEANGAWETARFPDPVMLMGSFRGVETTFRQLIRSKPLDVATVSVKGQSVRVPTLPEMIRIKGWLALTRNAYRDYLDLAALTRLAGPQATAEAFSSFDDCYADVRGKNLKKDVSPLLQLSRQLCEPIPFDLEQIDEMQRYKSAVSEWDGWDKVKAQCHDVGILAASVAVDLAARKALDVGSVGRVEAPQHPDGSHNVSWSKDGKTAIVREWDPARGTFFAVGNTLGPAVVEPGKVIYALHGKRMTKEEWETLPEVAAAKASRSSTP